MLPFELAPRADASILSSSWAAGNNNDTAAAQRTPESFSTSDYGPTLEMLSSSEADVVAAYGPLVTEQALSRSAAAATPGDTPPAAVSTVAAASIRKRDRLDERLDGAAGQNSVVGDAVAPAFSPHGSVTAASDYQGRSFLHVPSNLKTTPATSCRPPTRTLCVLKGHEAGVQCLAWMPPVGHLLFSADLVGNVRLWDASSRKQIGLYAAHTMPIRSLQVSSSTTAPRMSTASVDGSIQQWDVETATLTESLRHASGKPCLTHAYHPFNSLTASEGPGGDARLIVAAVHDKVVLWDLRQSCDKPQREYSGHTGAVLNISFLDGGRKLLTTSEDKTLRTWEFRVPVQIKQFADAARHALSHVQRHPTEALLAAQSFDDSIVVIADEGGGRVKFVGDRVFKGHTIAGSACQLQFSPDGQFISSGDVTGALHIWKWRSGERVRVIPAHAPGKPLVAHVWHPTEPNRLVTSSWDGTIKFWG